MRQLTAPAERPLRPIAGHKQNDTVEMQLRQGAQPGIRPTALISAATRHGNARAGSQLSR